MLRLFVKNYRPFALLKSLKDAETARADYSARSTHLGAKKSGGTHPETAPFHNQAKRVLNRVERSQQVELFEKIIDESTQPTAAVQQGGMDALMKKMARAAVNKGVVFAVYLPVVL